MPAANSGLGSGSRQLGDSWSWTASAERWRDAAASWVDRRVLGALMSRLTQVPVRVVLWDGTSAGPDAAQYTVRIGTRRALLGLVMDPDMAFGDYYASGAIDVQGDLTGLMEAIYAGFPHAATTKPGAWRRFGRWANTERRARQQIHHHYDIGNDFYRLWLDERMQYTCAYFPTPDVSLEEAQVAKMDHVCRKLALKPGEHVVEAGCGWGELAMHMADRYGVTVRAYNISTEQIAWAREKARERGLADRVQFFEQDYRTIEGRADVFVSVGMLEHVGASHYDALAAVIDRTLDPAHGRGLLHFIGRSRPMQLHPWIEKRIFPGAYPPTLSEVVTRILEPLDLAVLDIENLRLHYARTLEHWRDRFEASFERVVAMYDRAFARAWRVYLTGSVAGFKMGSMQLFQVVFARNGNNSMPWTRAGVYRAG